ncbi:MAG TPA: PIG-L family deacetylase, partial [Solirubrobacteraceae bacterium]|nr:PIG-L family deacetylase [Solirubrobacteraceae bacterium]
MSTAPDRKRDAYASPGQSERRPQVLLLDPDPDRAALRTEWLRDGGYDVTHVVTSESAVERIPRMSDLDLVVCDPSPTAKTGSGVDIVRASKSIRPTVPVLAIVGRSNISPPLGLLRGSPDATLIEPIGRAALLSRVGLLVWRNGSGGGRGGGEHTVLAIGAHPDDVEIGVGGTLLRHAAAGDRIILLLMTDGEAGGNKRQRVAEAEHAAEYLNATLVRTGLPDTFLSEARRAVLVMEDVVAHYHPTVVYVHSCHDSHQDHRGTYNAAVVAAREVPEVYCYQSPSSTVEFAPNRFTDVGPHLDAKVEMIR